MPRSRLPQESHTFNHALGDLVRKERKRQNFNQTQLAEQAGISRSALANIEVGRQQITVSQLCKFAHALGIDAAELIPQGPAETLSSLNGITFPPDLPLSPRRDIAEAVSKPPHKTPPGPPKRGLTTPSRFLSLLAWKCRREGARLVEVDRFYPSSKTCSACGEVNAGLGMEWHWACPSCGVRHQRDDNAARNLRRQGLAADVEGVSDGRMAAVPGEASTRQIILD